MQKPNLLHSVLILCLVCAASLSCSAPSGQTQPTASSDQTTSTRGPGSFDLTDATTGLQSLASYQAVLQTSFNGKISSVEQSWNSSYTFLASAARDARLLFISQTGLPEDTSMDGWIIGKADGLVYNRLGAANPCGALTLNAENAPAAFEPAQMLPPVAGAEVVSADESLDGVSVTHYRFDERAVDMAGLGSAQGEMWIARDGGYVVKYSLRIQSDQAIYDPEQTGTMTWDYSLTKANQPVGIALPEDCPAGMAGLPLPQEAANGKRLPGYLSFTTDKTLPEVVEYFEQNLATAGFQEDAPDLVNDQRAYLEYTDGSRSLSLWAEAGTPTTVSLAMSYGRVPVTEVPVPTPEPTQMAAMDNSMRISQSLTLVMGDDDTPGVFPSYHMEFAQTLPVLDAASGSLGTNRLQFSADVQGTDVHLVSSEQSGEQAPEITEGYLIGETNYLMADGQVKEDIFGIQMLWITWPLDMIFPMSMAGMGSEALGSETIDGRLADKYLMDSAKADPVSLETFKGMMGSFGPQILEAHGTIWLDQQTGGLLKLELDYTQEILDAERKAVGTGAGRIEITITKVGQVTVELP